MNFSEGFKKYFFNTSWLMAERVFRMVVALFVGVYVARYLGPEQFGLLSYAISFVGLFLALSTLGLDGIVIRELVKTPERRDELLGTAFGLKICGALLMWAGITVALSFIDSDRQTNTLIAIIAFSAIFQAFNVIDFNYQAEVKAKLVVHAQFIQLILSSIFKLTLISTGASLIWFAYAYLFDAVILTLGWFITYSRYSGKIFGWRLKIQTAKKFLAEGWPLILSGLAVSIYLRIDQVMIKEMLGTKEVGLYAAAVKLSEAWYFVPLVICNSVFPAIINAKAEGRIYYLKRLQQLYELLALLSIMFALPVTFLSGWIVHLLYGYDFIQTGNVLKILVWTGFFVALGTASGKWLLAENLQLIAFYRTVTGMIVNIILNLILIPQYKIIGAAISTIISYATAAYLFDLFFAKTREQFFLKTKSFPGVRYVFKAINQTST